MIRYQVKDKQGIEAVQQLIKRWLHRKRPVKEQLAWTWAHLMNNDREEFSTQDAADLLALTMRSPVILTHSKDEKWPFLAVDPKSESLRYRFDLAWSKDGVLVSTDGRRMHVTKLREDLPKELRTYNSKGEQVDIPEDFNHPCIDRIFSPEDFYPNAPDWRTIHLLSLTNTPEFWIVPDSPFDTGILGIRIEDRIVNARYLLEAAQSDYVQYKWKNGMLVVIPSRDKLYGCSVAYVMPLEN